MIPSATAFLGTEVVWLCRVRSSYESLMDDRYDKPVIELGVGEKKEVLSVGTSAGGMG